MKKFVLLLLITVVPAQTSALLDGHEVIVDAFQVMDQMANYAQLSESQFIAVHKLVDKFKWGGPLVPLSLYSTPALTINAQFLALLKPYVAKKRIPFLHDCLFGAIGRNRLDIIEIVVQNDTVDINALSQGAITPRSALHFAIDHCYCSPEIVEYLLQNGANPEVLDSEGETPLAWAARSVVCDGFKSEVTQQKIKILLNYGANLNVVNNKGHSFEQVMYGKYHDLKEYCADKYGAEQPLRESRERIKEVCELPEVAARRAPALPLADQEQSWQQAHAVQCIEQEFAAVEPQLEPSVSALIEDRDHKEVEGKARVASLPVGDPADVVKVLLRGIRQENGKMGERIGLRKRAGRKTFQV